MNIKTIVIIKIAIQMLERHKRLLVESAGEDLGYPDLDQAIQALKDVRE